MAPNYPTRHRHSQSVSNKMGRHYSSLAESIWANCIPVTESGCWIWINATLSKNGYGQLTYQKEHLLSHRAAWIAFVGDIPEGQFVLHKCDIKTCVNPDHLFLGTQRENVDDMFAKNRQAKRTSLTSKQAKLTPQQVSEIRLSPMSNRELRKQYSIGKSAIHNIKNGTSWKDNDNAS